MQRGTKQALTKCKQAVGQFVGAGRASKLRPGPIGSKVRRHVWLSQVLEKEAVF